MFATQTSIIFQFNSNLPMLSPFDSQDSQMCLYSYLCEVRLDDLKIIISPTLQKIVYKKRNVISN